MVEHKDVVIADLQQGHQAWVEEMRTTLAPVQQPEAGVWGRWGAVQYLDHEFAPRFRRERDALATVADRMPASRAGYIWALGELLELLLDRLTELGQMVQTGTFFAEAACKFLRAFECWCDEAEQGVRALPAGALQSAAVGGVAPLLDRSAPGAATNLVTAKR